MKRLNATFLITAILIIGTLNVYAQKAEKTSSAKAYYGYSSQKPKLNVNKKQKTQKYSRKRSVKGATSNAKRTAYRRRHS